MMTQIILTDLDGTLLNTASEISSLNLKGINALKNAGIDFAIVSGRSCNYLEKITNYYDINCHLIGLNGAEIKLKDSEIITMDVIPQVTIKKIITFLEEKEIIFQAFTVNEELVHTGDFVVDQVLNIAKQKFSDNRDILQSALYFYLELFEGKKQLEYMNEYITTNAKEILKLEIIESSDYKRKNIIDRLNKYKDINVTNISTNSLEINSKKVNKGLAVRFLLKQLNFDKNRAIGIGDGVNDIELFKNVGKSICVSNSPEFIKSRVNKVIGSNDSNEIGNLFLDVAKGVSL